MNQGLRELYRAEYETDPDITIDELCTKHNIERTALGPTHDWQKVIDLPTSSVIPTSPTDDIEPGKALPTQIPIVSKDVTDVSSPKDMIDNFKQITLAEALYRMKTEANELAIKDMRELVALVDVIDKSYNKSTDTNTINIVVQNVIAKYVDDC